MRHWFMLIAVVVIIGGVTLIGSKYFGATTCRSSQDFQVMFKDNQATPATIQGATCDRITFTNDDAVTRLVAFGPHEDHVAYDGVTEELLGKGQSFTIDLDKTGTFYFHDHLHDEVHGSFTVTP